MYNQGWQDALVHLTKEAMHQKRIFKKTYQELQDES